VRSACLFAIIVFVATGAMATSSRTFVPIAGHSVTVDTLRLDVLDAQATRWTPPPGASVAHFATVRATDGATVRMLTLSDVPTRVPVVKDHAIRFTDMPLAISVTPVPALAIDAIAAERIAVAGAKTLGWNATTPSTVLLTFGTTWEISFQLGADMDGVVQIDAATGHVISASKSGGF
jgi:hypothetical protein